MQSSEISTACVGEEPFLYTDGQTWLRVHSFGEWGFSMRNTQQHLHHTMLSMEIDLPLFINMGGVTFKPRKKPQAGDLALDGIP